jgi:cellulose synthase/poly-beta-1,6-N-acetylglucosamine synthase-like glycosyltransferase
MNSFRINRPHSGKYSYAIRKEQRWLIRLLGILSLFSTACLAYGYAHFITNGIAWAFMALPFLIIILYFCIDAITQLFFPGFDVDRHKKFVRGYWQDATAAPSVAVFIPAAGESPHTVERTAAAAQAMDYPRKTVYILDDTNDGRYRQVASRVGAQYVHRPNTGVDKKSGNLNYALEHTPQSDHVLVLDADFVPRRSMLQEIVPYTTADIALIQTPQHFELSQRVFDRSKIEYGAGYIQREFYGLTQTARDRFGAAICVGTNALYNRRALEDIDGFARVDHSEDVITGLKTLNHIRPNGESYRIKYLPIQLATGTSPKTYYSFFRQQNRWATGTIGFSCKSLFSHTLRPTQKLIYFSNCLYYLYTLSMLFLPFQLLALWSSSNDTPTNYTYLFIPQILVRLLILPYVMRREHRRLASILTVTASAFIFLQAFYMLLRRRPLGWEITGAATGAKPRHSEFWRLKMFAIGYYTIMYLGTLAAGIWAQQLNLHNAALLQLLFGFSLLTQTLHLVYMLLFADDEKAPKLAKVARPGLSLLGNVSYTRLLRTLTTLRVSSLSKHLTFARESAE